MPPRSVTTIHRLPAFQTKVYRPYLCPATCTSVESNGSPGKAMSPIASRKAGGKPAGRAILTAPGGAGQSRGAACANTAETAIANVPAVMQTHFTDLDNNTHLGRWRGVILNQCEIVRRS